MQSRHDLTDEQWAKLERLLPDRTTIRGGRWMDHRKVINGVLWRTRSGSAWRDLPPEYGNWKTVYNRLRFPPCSGQLVPRARSESGVLPSSS